MIFLEINECMQATDACHEDATCSNTDGSYICDCNNGYIGDGKSCAGTWSGRNKLYWKGLKAKYFECFLVIYLNLNVRFEAKVASIFDVTHTALWQYILH